MQFGWSVPDIDPEPSEGNHSWHNNYTQYCTIDFTESGSGCQVILLSESFSAFKAMPTRQLQLLQRSESEMGELANLIDILSILFYLGKIFGKDWGNLRFSWQEYARYARVVYDSMEYVYYPVRYSSFVNWFIDVYRICMDLHVTSTCHDQNLIRLMVRRSGDVRSPPCF